MYKLAFGPWRPFLPSRPTKDTGAQITLWELESSQEGLYGPPTMAKFPTTQDGGTSVIMAA
jgi:hypothetical protein